MSANTRMNPPAKKGPERPRRPPMNTWEKIQKFLQDHRREQADYLVELCRINSHTLNKPGVDRVAASLFERLQPVFSDHRIYPEPEIGNHHRLRNHDADRSIYLIGHLDTVFPEDHPFRECRRRGDVLTGPGTADMKGGLAVFVYALLALQAAGVADKIPLTLILNSDEETGSVRSRRIFLRERRRASACLTGECAGPGGDIVVSRNGKLGARLECRGRDRHVGTGGAAKHSAVLDLAHRIVELEGLNDIRPGVTLNVGRIEGGLGPSTVPALARAWLDLRWQRDAHRRVLLKEIRKRISAPGPGCGPARFEILNARPAMPETPENASLYRILLKTAGRLGQSIPKEHRRGTSDANFFGSVGIPTLDGFGPIGDKDHTDHEFIRLSSLLERTRLLAVFLWEYARIQRMIAT